MSDLDQTYPAISDLRARARRRLPRFVWDFLDSGTGTEATTRRNRAKLDEIRFRPDALFGELDYRLGTSLLGRDHALPIGISPVGMSGLVWPDAEIELAKLGRERNIPYGLSTVATERPEAVGPQTGGDGWLQLYPPRDPEIRADMLKRSRDAGFRTLVLTVDVPEPSRRERQRRGGLTHPPRLSPRILSQCVPKPAWSLQMGRRVLRKGMPRLAFIEDYTGASGPMSSTAHAGYMIRVSPDWDYLRALRELWNGPVVVKGVLDPETAVRLQAEGVDAVWVSNHAGRQFDGALAAIEVLPAVRAAVGPDYPLIFDSGVEGALDVLRALALGADFVMLGRAFHYGLAAFGPRGAAHVVDIMTADLKANLGQLGLSDYAGLAERVIRPG
ncbi:alpha-hydroxy acid oxidase [Psychromarinibacter sp. C21-152]|uniref:Alpha-hydroxy acid oxidase n=1 Tax=Psychromarinibacter sediminicola TaxID=3033385 RepID=A0AAE3NSJ7_9RHOB|nr:alpha-hydroxy acid oxidase [Psychromarinibacter sediminicola]MDF0600165.1 alpha-hydroxy acid oxidase [Psychromarinibacter sediminicola]